MAVEMTPDKFVNLGFARGVQVLKLVNGLELDDVQAVGEYTVGFPLEQMFTLVRGNVRNGGEDIGTVSGGTFDTISMVDPPLSCFVIDVEILEVVVKVDGASAEIAAEKCCVCGEDGRDVDVPFTAKWNSEPSLPLVKVGDDSGCQLPCNILQMEAYQEGDTPGVRILTSPRNQATR